MAITVTPLQSKTKGTRYRAKVVVSGKPSTKTFGRKSDARKWATDKQKELEAAKGYDHINRPFRELVAEYLADNPKNADKKKKQLAYWSSKFGNKKMHELTTPMISQETKKLSRSTTSAGKIYAPATVVRYLAALSHCFNWGIEQGWLTFNPAEKVSRPPENNKRDRWLRPEELQRVLVQASTSRNPQLHNIILFAVLTGMRLGEIKNARWSDINNDTLRVPETKNGDVHLIHITPQLRKLFASQKDWANSHSGRSQYIFPSVSKHTDQLLDAPIGDFSHVWKQALMQANIDNFRFHDLRHTAATYLVLSGASGKITASTMGHKSLSASDRYQHVSAPYQAAALSTMHEKFLKI
jgi:integrase